MSTFTGQVGELSAEQGKGSGTALEARAVVKEFGETKALRGVDLTLVPGTIHGLVGPNGSGKTTLMRILMGETAADSGTFVLGDVKVDAGKFRGVQSTGTNIAMVHQEVPVFDNLRVFEHFAFHAGHRKKWRSATRKEAARALSELFPDSGISVDTVVSDLSLGQRQMLEIALAFSTRELDFLVLDEPTSALGRTQVKQLKDAVTHLRAEGIGVLLVSHRLEDILTVCDTITVLRAGVVAATGPSTDFDATSLVVAMGGAAKSTIEAPVVGAGAHGDEDDRNIVVEAQFEGGTGLSVISHRGEIVGLSGLAGSGQSELLERVLREFQRGDKVATMVSGDRRARGIFTSWNILRNITVASLSGLTSWTWIRKSGEIEVYKKWRERLKMAAPNPADPVLSLSGGTQQKVLIARALAANPTLLLLDDPTRGVDPTTKAELYELLRTTGREGRAVLWYSTEDEEMLQCDRVYVMRAGRIERELSGPELTREAIVAASFEGASSHVGGQEASQSSVRRDLLRWTRHGWFLAGALLVALFIGCWVREPLSVTETGLPILVSSFTPLVFAAAAEMCIIAVSDIDLGLGAFMGLVNAISATTLISHPLVGIVEIVACGVGYAGQSLFVAIRKIPAIIVTLGFSFVWLGLGLIIVPQPGGSSPGWLTSIGSANLPIVPEPLLVAAIVAAGTAWLFYRTRFGLRVRAVGNNPDGYAVHARSNGAAVRARASAWALAAVFAVLAGLSVTALTASADPSASQPNTLLGIAAVIMGGGYFIGGRIDAVGAVLAALMIGLLASFLGLTPINVEYTSLVEGVVLVAVLGLRLVFRPRVRQRRDELLLRSVSLGAARPNSVSVRATVDGRAKP